MYNSIFSRENDFMKGMAGLVLAALTIVSVYANIPANAYAASITGLTAEAYAEDANKTVLGPNDQVIVALDYRTSFDDLQVDPAGSCTVNGKDVKSTFQSFGDGTYQLVYTIAEGDANVTAGQLPFSCAFTDTGGNTGVLTGFTSANTVAISTTGGTNTGGNNDGGNNTGGNGDGELPPPGTFTVTVDPSDGTLTPGQPLIIVINDRGGITDFAVDPSGVCTINGRDVKSSFQAFGDHHYQMVYTVREGDPNVAAGQLAVMCNVKNPAGTTGTINSISANTLAINGTTDTGGNNDGGNNNGGNTGIITNATVSAVPNTGTLGVGQTLEVRIHQNDGMEDLTLDGACTVNGVNVNNFENLHNGDYKVTYTVAGQHANAIAGEVQFICNVRNSTGSIATLHFTDNNTVAINAQPTNTGGNNNGGNNNTGGSNTDGTIDGDVNTPGENGVLAVTGIDQVRTTAIADGTIENGWKWIFHVTVPSDEHLFQIKFGNWMHSNNVNSISPANNMRFSSNQMANVNPISITGSNDYTLPVSVTGDLNPALPGKQIDLVVEMGVPVGSTNGSYSTTYNIKTSAN